MNLHAVAPPLDAATVDVNHEPRQLGDRRSGRVAAGFPLRIKQRRRTRRLNRDRFMDREDLMVGVGGGDGQTNGPAIRPIIWCNDRCWQRQRTRLGDHLGVERRKHTCEETQCRDNGFHVAVIMRYEDQCL